jgi:hypothetical protein
MNPTTAHEPALRWHDLEVVPIAPYSVSGFPALPIEPNVGLPLNDIEMREFLLIPIRFLECLKRQRAL